MSGVPHNVGPLCFPAGCPDHNPMPTDDVLALVTQQRDRAVELLRRMRCPSCDNSEAVYGGPPDEWCDSPRHAAVYKFLESLG